MASRQHNFPPPDAPDCTLCRDEGFNNHTGQWAFCLCPAGQAAKKKDPSACDDMNFSLKKMEDHTK